MQKKFLFLIVCAANSYSMQKIKTDNAFAASVRFHCVKLGADALITSIKKDDLANVNEILNGYYEDYHSSLAKDYRSKEGVTLLHYAVVHEKERIVERLLKEPGIEVDAAEDQGYTPLILSAVAGNLAIAQKLIAAGADKNKLNKDGASTVIMAQAMGHNEMVKFLTSNSKL